MVYLHLMQATVMYDSGSSCDLDVALAHPFSKDAVTGGRLCSSKKRRAKEGSLNTMLKSFLTVPSSFTT